MTKNYMIAVCDILGFSNLIMNFPLDKIVSNSLVFFQKALYQAMHHKDFPQNPPTLQELKRQNRLGFAWFSDTVVFYTLKDNDEDCRTLLDTVAWLMLLTVFKPDTRIRTGISYGEAHMDEENDIYVGPALVEAYKLEKQQEWAGGALTISAEKRIPPDVIHNKGIINSIFEWYIIPYDVPLKSAQGHRSERMLAIDWTRKGIHPYNEFPWSRKSKFPTPEDERLQPDLVRKWKNTKAFHDKVCESCRKRVKGC